MAVRIISACVALPLFFLLIYVFPAYVFPFAVAALSVIAVYEMLWRSSVMKNKYLAGSAYVFAAFIPLAVYFNISTIFIFAVLFLLVIFNFFVWITKQENICFKDVTSAFFSCVVISVFFSSIINIFKMDDGKILILIPFVAAWITDTGAYFTGMFLGKHKLAPKISPKKTVEGAIGGVVFCIISFLVYGIIIGASGNYLLIFALCGFVLSVISQIGDLSMSLIKREYNIKDYGVVFPGHGGILDRFDSVLFTAPASYILIELLKEIVLFVGM